MGDGVRTTTIEVPIEVWRAINRQGRGSDRAAANSRAKARKLLQVRAIELVRGGWKVSAAAHHLNVPDRTVFRWTRHLRTATTERPNE